MGGSQKAPPRLPPRRLPQAYRVYAHVGGTFDATCPACGRLNLIGARTKIHRGGHHDRGYHAPGYDTLAGVLTCRGCRKRWYVGVVLWPLTPGKRGRPRDHVLSREEIAQLQEEYGTGYAKTAPAPGGGRPHVNLVCWCGAECPAHPVEDEEGDADD